MPFLTPFLGGGSPTEIDCREKGNFILTSLLEDLENMSVEWIPDSVLKFKGRPSGKPAVLGYKVSPLVLVWVNS